MKNQRMKTSVELVTEKVAMAKRLGGISTLKELLDHALDAYIAQSRRQAMAGMLGTGFFSGDLASMRKRHGRSGR